MRKEQFPLRLTGKSPDLPEPKSRCESQSCFLAASLDHTSQPGVLGIAPSLSCSFSAVAVFPFPFPDVPVTPAAALFCTCPQVFPISIVEAAVEGRSEELECETPSPALDRLLSSCCFDALSSLLSSRPRQPAQPWRLRLSAPQPRPPLQPPSPLNTTTLEITGATTVT